MCGIAGWCLTERPSLAFALTMAAQIEERGRDSFGFYDGETKEVFKALYAVTASLPASRLQFSHGFLHTRHATTGATSAKNSHPFQIGDVLGAHNGVIYNHYEIDKKYKRLFAVDSMHIFAHISEGLNLSELEGYGAIEYVKDGEYYIAASNEGALEVALTDKGVVWASTREAIDAAIFQAGYTLKHYFQIEQDAVYHVKADNLYDTDKTFCLRDKIWTKLPSVSKTGIRDETSLFGTSATMQQWERDLEREERKYDGMVSAFHTSDDMPDGAPVSTQDTCHWCGEFCKVYPQDDSSLACADCASMWGEYLEEDEERQALTPRDTSTQAPITLA